MDAPLILADQILGMIREGGLTRQEATVALTTALNTLPLLTDIPIGGEGPAVAGQQNAGSPFTGGAI